MAGISDYKKPRTKDETMMAMYDGSLYPAEYSFTNTPIEPTAYQPRTFENLLDFMYSPEDGLNSINQVLGYNYQNFADDNRQNIRADDLVDNAHIDMLDNRSALMALAMEDRKNMFRTGDNIDPVGGGYFKSGAAIMEYPFGWASRTMYGDKDIPTLAHESLHQKMSELSNSDEMPDNIKSELVDPDMQHLLLSVMNKDLYGEYDPRYLPKDADWKDAGKEMEIARNVLDELEKYSQKEIGKRISKKNQGRISRR